MRPRNDNARRRLEKQKETEQHLKDQQESNQRLRKWAIALGATVVTAVVAAFLAAYQGTISFKEKAIAVAQTENAKIAETKAVDAADGGEKARAEGEGIRGESRCSRLGSEHARTTCQEKPSGGQGREPGRLVVGGKLA